MVICHRTVQVCLVFIVILVCFQLHMAGGEPEWLLVNIDDNSRYMASMAHVRTNLSVIMDVYKDEISEGALEKLSDMFNHMTEAQVMFEAILAALPTRREQHIMATAAAIREGDSIASSTLASANGMYLADSSGTSSTTPYGGDDSSISYATMDIPTLTAHVMVLAHQVQEDQRKGGNGKQGKGHGHGGDHQVQEDQRRGGKGKQGKGHGHVHTMTKYHGWEA